MTHAHVPKRATQHGLYVSTQETIPPTLKPGQSDLRRKGLYDFEARKTFSQTTSLSLDLGNRSVLREMQMATSPDDYRKTAVSARPPDTSASAGVAPASARHWQTECKAKTFETASEAVLEPPVAARRKYQQPTNPTAHALGREDMLTTTHHHFGKYGSNPRSRVDHGNTKLEVWKDHLNNGTTRGTGHIPGYQGFIAENPPLTAKTVSGEAVRSIDKTNIAENYHTNLVGYRGHKPISCKNDNGGRKVSELTTMDREFAKACRTARF